MAPRSVEGRIVALFTDHLPRSASEVAATVGVSRQAAHRHLARLVARGELIGEGKARASRYRNPGSLPFTRRYVRAEIAEDQVWQEIASILPAIGSLPREARSVFQYAFTEMLNNAIEHSASKEVEVRWGASGNRLSFEIVDEGRGIFAHLRKTLRLGSDLEALQALSKGKLTTLPKGHTGEGIFFTSKVADLFELESRGLRWIVDNVREDVAVGVTPYRKGTQVRFEAGRRPRRNLADVFAEYTENFEFQKTRVVVKLFQRGATFISRSEARRVLDRLDRFREVILDFHGVEEVGQGFADEVCRVWPAAHRGTRIDPVNMTKGIAFMIERARRTGLR